MLEGLDHAGKPPESLRCRNGRDELLLVLVVFVVLTATAVLAVLAMLLLLLW